MIVRINPLLKLRVVFLSIVFIFGASVLPSFTEEVNAANGADFNPGRIIDDDVFYNNGAMSTSQIQTFLNARVPSCDTNGSGIATEFNSSLTRAQFAASQGWNAPPYTCLKDYRQNVPQTEAASGLCGAISAVSNQTAAQIIKSVSNACGINPQVLLVTLQKEQSLVTDIWPLTQQYTSATGFACPDTASCNPAYAGFFNQVYFAARQFKVYKQFPNNYNYRAGQTNTIYWHPDLSRCGSSSVFIQNQATAALYIYTPYRPNQAALNNLYGTGDSCSSYGNRNFWRQFTDWFGSTQLSFQSLATPRVMQIATNTQKINLHTNTAFGPVLNAGAQTYFVDMVFIYGEWHVRTEFDHNNNNFTGIPVSDIGDIPITSITPRWISVENASTKYDPYRRTNLGPIQAQSAARVLSSVTISGVEYLRTEFDHSAGRNHFIRASDTSEFQFFDFDQARTLASTGPANKFDTSDNSVVGTVAERSLLFFNKKLTIGGEQYIQTSTDSGTSRAFKFADFTEVTNDANDYFVPLDSPRWMELRIDTRKSQTLYPGLEFGPSLTAGSQAYFTDKIRVDGVWYARTQFDKNNGTSHAIRATDLIDIQATPISPVWLSIPSATAKIDPARGSLYETVNGLAAAQFVDSITVNGIEYLRTAYESSQDRPRFIPSADLVAFTFFDFVQPRLMTNPATVNRVNAQTGQVISTIPANTTLFYNKRITINGVLYAQSEADNGTSIAVRAGFLR